MQFASYFRFWRENSFQIGLCRISLASSFLKAVFMPYYENIVSWIILVSSLISTSCDYVLEKPIECVPVSKSAIVDTHVESSLETYSAQLHSAAVQDSQCSSVLMLEFLHSALRIPLTLPIAHCCSHQYVCEKLEKFFTNNFIT